MFSLSTMLRVSIFAAGLSLMACQSTPPAAVWTTEWTTQNGTMPKKYKEQVREQVLLTFKDPSSIRNARVSEPQPRNMILNGMLFDHGWMVCLHANAKNSYGGYTGLRYTIFMFRHSQPFQFVHGQLTSKHDAIIESFCAEARGWTDLYDKRNPPPKM